MWFWVDADETLLWDPELADGWPSCFCPLNRLPWPCGDLGGFPTWPWFSVLDEAEPCLAWVCGLGEWEDELEPRWEFEPPSWLVTEIWGSDRPGDWKRMKSNLEQDNIKNLMELVIYLVLLKTNKTFLLFNLGCTKVIDQDSLMHLP